MNVAWRENLQPLRLLAVELEGALGAGAEVDTTDTRPRTARAIADVVSRADDALARSAASVSVADQTLGPGWMNACAARP